MNQFLVNSALHYQVNGPTTFLLALRCCRSGGQKVIDESISTSLPADRSDLCSGLPGNSFTRLNIQDSGDLSINYRATAEVAYQLVAIDQITERGIDSVGEYELPYLFPSRYAPSDQIRGTANDFFGHIEGSFAKALAIEDWLYQHILYEAGASDEQSTAADTLLSRAGVCRDFAHLGIAFCRALNLPARYVTMYAYQLQPQDFHAVFEVFIGGTWYLFDGTRTAPLNGMIRTASGQDASDVSMATIFGNVLGTGVEVDVSETSGGENFLPITRESLVEQGQAIYLV